MLRWIVLAALLVGPVWAAKKPPLRTPLGPPIQAVGFGATALEARNNALQNALERADIDQPDTPLTLALVDRFALVEQGDPMPSDVLAGQELVQVRVSLTLTRELLAAAQASQRELRASERQILLGRIVAGFLLVIMVLVGYLQLEEWTKGYATRLLRLLAALSLIAGALVLWLVR